MNAMNGLSVRPVQTGLVVVAACLMSCVSSALAGDVAAGRDKSMDCLACHGAVGVSDHYMWPTLAGQQQGYLVKQMKDFRDGARHDPWMSPMARWLTDEDIDDLAAYYSGLESPAGRPAQVPRNAQTCVACHDQGGVGENTLWPNLAGQHARYLAKQLRDYRAGDRKDPVMAPLAMVLSDEDIEALAAYYAGL